MGCIPSSAFLAPYSTFVITEPLSVPHHDHLSPIDFESCASITLLVLELEQGQQQVGL